MRPAGEVLDEVEQRRLGPVDVLEQRRPAAARARAPRTAGAPPRTSRRPARAVGGRTDCARARVRRPARASSTPARAQRARRRRSPSVPTICTSGQNVMPSPYGRQRPVSDVAPVAHAVGTARARAATCRCRPGRRSCTSRQARSRPRRRRRRAACCSSSSRPTSGASRRRAYAGAPRSPRARSRQRTGSLLPFRPRARPGARARPRSRRAAACRLADAGSRPVRAASSSRFATLTGVAGDEHLPAGAVAGDDLARVDADADPDAHAELALELLVQPGQRLAHLVAARTARSASSSCSSGTPKTAITASPMNFSTVPPWRSSTVAHLSKYRDITRPQRLGVEPLAERRRVGDVGEEHRDGFDLRARLDGHVLERLATRQLRALRALLAGAQAPWQRRGRRPPETSARARLHLAAVFDALSDRLQSALGDLRGRGKLDEEAISRAMREIRLALLEADVNFQVVKELRRAGARARARPGGAEEPHAGPAGREGRPRGADRR